MQPPEMQPELPQILSDEEKILRAQLLGRGVFVMRALRNLQAFGSIEDILQDKDLLKTGVTTWPGNGAPITTEDRNKADAGYALLGIRSVLRGNKSGLHCIDEYDTYNEFIPRACRALGACGMYNTELDIPVDELDLVSMPLRDLGHALHRNQNVFGIARTWLHKYEHQGALKTEVRKVRGIFRSRPDIAIRCFDAGAAVTHIDQTDFSQTVPDGLTSQGLESYDLSNLLAGVPTQEYKMPAYDALFSEQKFVQAFDFLEEDLTRLASTE